MKLKHLGGDLQEAGAAGQGGAHWHDAGGFPFGVPTAAAGHMMSTMRAGMVGGPGGAPVAQGGMVVAGAVLQHLGPVVGKNAPHLSPLRRVGHLRCRRGGWLHAGGARMLGCRGVGGKGNPPAVPIAGLLPGAHHDHARQAAPVVSTGP